MLGLPNPYVVVGVALVIAALAGWGVTEHQLRAAAVKGEAAARLESDLHSADAERWHKASDDRDIALAGLNQRIDTQNTAINALATAKAKAEQFAIEAAAESARAQSKANNLITQWEQRAHDHPEEARPLGPAACAAYRELYGETAACTHPGANPAP
jgi:hypothetical protein